MITQNMRLSIKYTTQKVRKEGNRNEVSLINQNLILKYVHSKATYLLRVHQFTQQVGEGCKRRNKFSLSIQNPILSMHKHVHSKATYLLRVHQFTTQQVGKGTEGMNFHSSCKIQSRVCANTFIQSNLPAKCAPVDNKASG